MISNQVPGALSVQYIYRLTTLGPGQDSHSNETSRCITAMCITSARGHCHLARYQNDVMI